MTKKNIKDNQNQISNDYKKEKYNKEYLLQFLEQGIFEAKLK